MEYYFNTVIENAPFDAATILVKKALEEQGFGVLTEIDIQQTLKIKLGVNFYNYKILGACNPPLAYKALQAEDKIGLLLPCNVIIQEKRENSIEVSAINPSLAMGGIQNPELENVSHNVSELLKKVITNIASFQKSI